MPGIFGGIVLHRSSFVRDLTAHSIANFALDAVTCRKLEVPHFIREGETRFKRLFDGIMKNGPRITEREHGAASKTSPPERLPIQSQAVSKRFDAVAPSILLDPCDGLRLGPWLAEPALHGGLIAQRKTIDAILFSYSEDERERVVHQPKTFDAPENLERRRLEPFAVGFEQIGEEGPRNDPASLWIGRLGQRADELDANGESADVDERTVTKAFRSMWREKLGVDSRSVGRVFIDKDVGRPFEADACVERAHRRMGETKIGGGRASNMDPWLIEEERMGPPRALGARALNDQSDRHVERPYRSLARGQISRGLPRVAIVVSRLCRKLDNSPTDRALSRGPRSIAAKRVTMAGIERRDRHNPRVRLGGLPIELAEDDLPGGFEADAHDLGVGGVGIRSAFLPRIGSRLRLRLVSPEGGRPIEARGEVVWRDDAGPHEGAFGLRFDAMDGASAEEIARLIEVQRSGKGGPSLEAIEAIELEEPPHAEPSSEAPGEIEQTPRSENVDLHLDGVGESLEALLVHDGGDLVTLEQSLDFLSLGRGAALGDGRRGEIAAIELRVDNGLPRLAITLSFDEAFSEGSSLEGAHASDTAQSDGVDDDFVEASHVFAKGVRISSAGELEAVMEPLFEAEEAAREAVRLGEPLEAAARVVGEASGDTFGAAGDEAFESDKPASDLGYERQARHDATGAIEHDERLDAAEAAFFEQPRFQGTYVERPHDPLIEEPTGALVELRRFALRARLGAVEGYRRMKPHVERLATKFGARSSRILGTTFDAIMAFLRSIVVRSRHFTRAFVTRLLDRSSLEEAVPQNRPRRQQNAPEVPLESRKKSRTQLIVALGALLGLVAAFGWLVTGVKGREADESLPSAAESAPENEVAGSALQLPPSPGIDSSVAYGAENIPSAMIFELTLEGEPLTIRGEPFAEGVRVHIPDARALSRAGVIAANHPDIEYASIRNLEDGAELELRFVPGREPAYRVELRGLTLRVALSP